ETKTSGVVGSNRQSLKTNKIKIVENKYPKFYSGIMNGPSTRTWRTVDQYAQDMLVLFQCVARILKAIKKAQIYELTFAYSVATCGPALIYNMMTNPMTIQLLVPQVTCDVEALVVSLMRKIVSAMKSKDNWNTTGNVCPQPQALVAL
ncbi:18209_t:CDS:2, partial [Gigaspora rosea]